MRNFKIGFFLFFLFLTVSAQIQAADFVSVQSGSYSSVSTWSPSGIPAAGDNVTIAAGHIVTGASVTVNQLTVNGEFQHTSGEMNVNGTFTVNSGGVLNGNSQINLNGAIDIINNGTVSPSTVFIPGTTHNLSGTGTWSPTTFRFFSTGNTTLLNNITISAGTFRKENTGTLVLGANALTINGGNYHGGTMSATTGKIVLQGVTIVTGSTFSVPLEIASGTTTGSSITTNSFLSVIGTFQTSGTSNIFGDLNVAASGVLNGTLQLNLYSINTVNNGNISFPFLFISGANPNLSGSGTWSSSSQLSMNYTGTLTALSDISFLNAANVSFGSSFSIGTFNLNFNNVSLNISSSTMTSSGGKMLFQGTNTISGSNLIAAPIEILSGTTNASNTLGSSVTVFSGAIFGCNLSSVTINNDLTVNSGGTLAGTSCSVVINGVNFVNNGSVTVPTLSFQRSGNQNISGTGTYNNPSGSINLSVSGTKFLLNDLTTNYTINAGAILDLTNRILTTTRAGNSITGGASNFVTTGSTIVYAGTAAQDINQSINYHNLTINNSAGASLGGSGDTYINGVLTIENGAIFNHSQWRLWLNGNGTPFVNNGGTYAPTASSEVIYNGTTQQTALPTTYNSLRVANPQGVIFNGNVSVTGASFNLAGGVVEIGNNTITLAETTSIFRTSGYVIGNLRKLYNTGVGSAFTFHVGTANGYSPVGAVKQNNLAGELSVKAVQGAKSPPLNSATALQRYWTLNGSNVTVNLTFNYLQTDVMGTESAYRIFRISTGQTTDFPNACPSAPCVNTTANTATINNVSTFSDWTLGELIALSATANLSGRITASNGNGIGKAQVELINQQGETRTVTTSTFGYYNLQEIPVGETYILRVRHKNFTFADRVLTISEDIGELNIIGEPVSGN